MADEDQLNIDFGDDELNDPQYEEKIAAQETPDGATTEQTPDGEAQQSGDEGAAPQQQAEGGKPDGADASKGGDGDAQRPAEQQQADGAARTKTDKDGNLVDASGAVIAKAGAERRHYERVQQQGAYINRLEKELVAAKNADSMATALNEVPKKLGLDMRETELGLQAIASFKKDPVATAKWMLQETMRQGYTLQQIVGQDAQGQVNGGSLDLAAVKSMISEAVQPIIGDREAQQQATQAEEAAQREYEGFIAKHENASVHEDVIANMIRDNPSLTPEVAYWQLREYAAKHQYDFAQPLRAQAVARQQGDQQQPNGNANPQAQSQQPMPNGGAPVRDMTQQGAFADPDDAWDSIVNQSLREAGMLN